MRRVRIRIHHRHATPDETPLQVFTQQYAVAVAVAVVGGGGDDARIPIPQAMVCAQFHLGNESAAGGDFQLKDTGAGQQSIRCGLDWS